MLGGAVGAPHVAGVRCLGSVGCCLMFLSGVNTDELSFLSKESGSVREGAYAIESVAGGRHGVGGNSHSFHGAMGARLGTWQGQRLRGQGSIEVMGGAADGGGQDGRVVKAGALGDTHD